MTCRLIKSGPELDDESDVSLRLRKSIPLGKHLKVNISKTGLGVSAGVPGARASVHSSGRITTSYGVPGTGIYVRKDRRFGSQPAQKMPATASSETPSLDWALEVFHAVAETTEAEWAAMTEDEAQSVLAIQTTACAVIDSHMPELSFNATLQDALRIGFKVTAGILVVVVLLFMSMTGKTDQYGRSEVATSLPLLMVAFVLFFACGIGSHLSKRLRTLTKPPR